VRCGVTKAVDDYIHVDRGVEWAGLTCKLSPAIDYHGCSWRSDRFRPIPEFCLPWLPRMRILVYVDQKPLISGNVTRSSRMLFIWYQCIKPISQNHKLPLSGPVDLNPLERWNKFTIIPIERLGTRPGQILSRNELLQTWDRHYTNADEYASNQLQDGWCDGLYERYTVSFSRTFS